MSRVPTSQNVAYFSKVRFAAYSENSPSSSRVVDSLASSTQCATCQAAMFLTAVSFQNCITPHLASHCVLVGSFRLGENLRFSYPSTAEWKVAIEQAELLCDPHGSHICSVQHRTE
eukprot:4919454-Amphidinium_carterae.1